MTLAARQREGAMFGGFVDRPEVQRAQDGPDDEHGDDEAEVADTVDEESLLARVRIVAVAVVAPVKPEADEQERGQSDAFPADEHHHEVVGEDEDEHGEHKEVHVEEEAPVEFVPVHVADGIDMD